MFECLWLKQFVSDDALEQRLKVAGKVFGDSGSIQQTASCWRDMDESRHLDDAVSRAALPQALSGLVPTITSSHSQDKRPHPMQLARGQFPD